MTWFYWVVIAANAYLGLFAAVALLEWQERQRKEGVLARIQTAERSLHRTLNEGRCVSCTKRLGKPVSLMDEAHK